MWVLVLKFHGAQDTRQKQGKGNFSEDLKHGYGYICMHCQSLLCSDEQH